MVGSISRSAQSFARSISGNIGSLPDRVVYDSERSTLARTQSLIRSQYELTYLKYKAIELFTQCRSAFIYVPD
jgi:hypothetical protein